MRSTKAILNTKTTRRAQPLWLALVTQTFWSRSSASRINKTDYILYLPPLAKKFANGLHSAFDSGVIFLVFYLVVQKGHLGVDALQQKPPTGSEHYVFVLAIGCFSVLD